MSVDSLISIEMVHTHCMHAQIQNILSEGVVREDRNATECWLGSFVILGDPDQYCEETLYFCDFSGGYGLSVTPLDPPHGMHLKEGTCLKCSFQRMLIIGHKVGLDYNSWYACLPLIRQWIQTVCKL